MRPPRLNYGPLTRNIRLERWGSLPGGFIVSRADVADAMCAAMDDPATYLQAVGIAN